VRAARGIGRQLLDQFPQQAQRFRQIAGVASHLVSLTERVGEREPLVVPFAQPHRIAGVGDRIAGRFRVPGAGEQILRRNAEGARGNRA
jgi:hypothetical protein